MNEQPIPDFFVYGEPSRPLDVGFLHVETVQARRSVHEGKVSPHKHSHMSQLTFWTSGSGRYRIEDQLWDFSAPAVSFIPSRTVHGFSIEPGADAIVVSISDGALASVAPQTSLALNAACFVDAPAGHPGWERLAGTVDLIAEEYRGGRADSGQVMLPLVAVALSYVARLLAETRPPAERALPLATRLRDLVEAHFREGWSVDDYAGGLATSQHFLRQAARQMGEPGVKALVNERRLLEAKRLLLFTRRTVEAIAFEVGFDDPAYFSRFFRKRTGLSPAGWRARSPDRS